MVHRKQGSVTAQKTGQWSQEEYERRLDGYFTEVQPFIMKITELRGAHATPKFIFNGKEMLEVTHTWNSHEAETLYHTLQETIRMIHRKYFGGEDATVEQ